MLLNILNEYEKSDFDKVPIFDIDQKEEFFDISSATQYQNHFRKPKTLVAFILLKGYFKASGRFYQVKDFHQDDIQHVVDKLNLVKPPSFDNYHRVTYSDQKTIIAKSLGVVLFSDWKNNFIQEVDRLVKTALKPKQIIHTLLKTLDERKVEIPKYNVFADVITKALRKLEVDLLNDVSRILDQSQRDEIDSILELPKDPTKPISPSNPYLLTTIKAPEQEITPSKIKDSLKGFQVVADLFRQFNESLEKIELSDQLLNYYAVWLIKSKHIKFLAISEPAKKYLYFLAFIIYQYRIRQDLFVDTLLKCTQKFQNDIEKEIADDFLNQRPVRVQQTKKVIQMVRSLSDHVEHMRQLVFSNVQNDTEKIARIQEIFYDIDKSKGDRQAQQKKIEEELIKLETSISSGLKNQLMYEKYIKNYRKIQNRTAGIIRVLDFNKSTSNLDIIEAIDFFKSNNQVSSANKLPVKFMDSRSLQGMKDYPGDEWVIWKVVLFIKVVEHIKSGSLNLSNSERYRAVEEYLIAQERWINQKESLLDRAGLPFERDVKLFINRMTSSLHEQYVKTNENTKTNEHLTFTNSGAAKVVTPKVEKPDQSGLLDLLEDERGVIPLPLVLSEANLVSKFSENFLYFGQKGQKNIPSNEAFYAAIIGLGCNIGIRKMGQISKGVTPDSLDYLVKWYFSKENLDTANNKINSIINEMSLPKLYKKEVEKNHTSSDGQKFSVTVPSINANFSFKYFGSGRGVSAYSFIDETSRLYYNTVISSSEREAAYVIDGLMHNEDVESDIHSTDTHGFSEIIFGITNGIGVFFAPRIKNYKDQLKYTFKQNPRKSYDKLNYKIVPTAQTYINTDIVEEQWDNILRLLVTIKLRETTASRILKRLSSYSKQHPLYKSLKQVGRMFKTYFLLKYLDELELRQSTEKALNRIELSHQFAKAIFFGNNQEIKVRTKEEQEIAVATRHLIQNVIVLFNYLKISDLLSKTDNESEFQEIVQKVKNGSIMTWQHINIHGEYDFENLFDNGEISSFEFDKIRSLQVDAVS